jgi:hypothetical protein
MFRSYPVPHADAFGENDQGTVGFKNTSTKINVSLLA